MYKYEVLLVNDQTVNFESQHHINMLNALEINGARMVYFQDAGVYVNINQAKEIRVDEQVFKPNLGR